MRSSQDLFSLSLQLQTALKQVQKSVSLQDAEVSACQALLYLNINHFFIRENATYLPTLEFEMLLEQIADLSEDNQFQTELILQLIFISDILEERLPDKKRFTMIEQALAKFSDEMWFSLQIPRTMQSITLDYFEKKLGRRMGRVPVLIGNDITDFLEDSNFSYALYKPITNLLDGSSKSPEELMALITPLIEEFGKVHMNELYFMRLIRTLLQQEDFALIFLKAYQHVYDTSNDDTVTGKLLSKAPIFFSFFLENVGYEGLLHAISHSHFNLKEPKQKSLSDTYASYMSSYNFYINGTINENDDHFHALYKESPLMFYKALKSMFQSLKIDNQELLGKDLEQFPLYFKLAVQNQAPKLLKTIKEFLLLIYRVNAHAPQYQKRNTHLFLFIHWPVINEMFIIMGQAGVAYLRSHLAKTVLTLERTLSQVSVLPNYLIQLLKEYFNQNHAYFSQPKKLDEFKQILISLDILIAYYNKLEKLDDSFLEEYECQLLFDTSSPQELHDYLRDQILTELFEIDPTSLSQESKESIIDKLNNSDIFSLALVMGFMDDPLYRELMLQMIKSDLVHHNIDTFFHDVNQQHPAGAVIAQHNKHIADFLQANNIDPHHALSYSEKMHFVVTTGDGNKLPLENCYRTLWSYFEELKLILQNCIEPHTPAADKVKMENQLNAILRLIKTLSDLIENEKYKNQLLSRTLSQGNTQPLVIKIINNLKTLQNNPNISLRFKEFAKHILDIHAMIKSGNPPEETDDSIYYFSVEQWRKDHSETFSLGGDVGCCMAINGTQFPAMIYRRMDDAALFHVAIDRQTNKPAALIWLYLAVTPTNKVVLIANFFEVNAKYGVHDTVRKALLQGLLYFTQQYCLDNPGIDGFFMNPLTYGWNIKDIDNYPLDQLAITDKVGGPLLVDDNLLSYANQLPQLTRALYYFNSLKDETFHRFDLDILVKETKHCLALNKILKETFERYSSASLSPSEVIAKVITVHAVELKHFFTEPLVSNHNLQTYLQKIYEQHILDASLLKQQPEKAELRSKAFLFSNSQSAPKTVTSSRPKLRKGN